MKKKILILLFVLICLVGCGKKKDSNEERHIIQSKKEFFVQTIRSYITSVMLKANSGSLQIYDENTLYLVPVGDDKTKSCALLESRGYSPYGDWNYLYVGVVYQDYSYDYYVIGEDEKGNGVPFTDRDSLSFANAEDKIMYTGTKVNTPGYDILQKLYNTLEDKKIFSEIDGSANYNKLSNILKLTDGKYSKIVVIDPKNCES